MNAFTLRVKLPLLIAVASVITVSCMSVPKKPEGAVAVQTKFMQLQADANLSNYAPTEMIAAEQAIQAALTPREEKALGEHLVLIADRKVGIAEARAQQRLAEDQRKSLSDQREHAQLELHTKQLDLARLDAKNARQNSADMQKQITELNAKQTERGLVVTLGHLLFANGSSTLRRNADTSLNKLVTFMKQYPEQSALIEGHTDNVGSNEMNHILSQGRADAVKQWLMTNGVASNRLDASGKGELTPIASNDDETGRQQNRRVEIVIVNQATSSL